MPNPSASPSFTQDDTFMPEPIQQMAYIHSTLLFTTQTHPMKEKYEIWAMKMEYWIQNADHNLWRIVQQGNSPKRLGKDAKGNTDCSSPPVSLDEMNRLLYKGKISQGLEEEAYIYGYDNFRRFRVQLNQGKARPNNRHQPKLAPTHSAFMELLVRGSKPTYIHIKHDCSIQFPDNWSQKKDSRTKSLVPLIQVADAFYAACEFAMMGNLLPKVGLGFQEYFGVDEVFDLSTPSVFYSDPVEKEVKPLYSTFVKAGEMHAVPPPITGTYMPSPYQSDIEETQPQDPTKDIPPMRLISRLCQRSDVCKTPITYLQSCFFLFGDNSSASVPADRSDPAASRNRPQYLNLQNRPHPAGWFNPAARPLCRPSSVTLEEYTTTILGGPRVMVISSIHMVTHLNEPQGSSSQNWLGSPSSVLMALLKDLRVILVQEKAHTTSKLDFENVYYVEELQHFNLFSVSQICDKKNKVLFTDTDCLVLSEEFQLPDASQAKANLKMNPSHQMNRRMAHVNFKTINKLAKEGLVDGLPLKSDYFGKFAGKADDGYLVGYASNSKAYRVYNLPNKRVEETLNLRFLEDKPNVQGIGHEWYFDLDYLLISTSQYCASCTLFPATKVSAGCTMFCWKLSFLLDDCFPAGCTMVAGSYLFLLDDWFRLVRLWAMLLVDSFQLSVLILLSTCVCCWLTLFSLPTSHLVSALESNPEVETMYLLPDLCVFKMEERQLPLSPPMLAIAAAGDAADEPNAAANEAAGSTAEAYHAPHSPPFSPVRESTPEGTEQNGKDNLNSMEDDTILGGFHEETHAGPDDAPTTTADAAGRAEDRTSTSLSATA
ncbi:hypothetical protein Tco_1236953 [Tanacetum coccineum]